MSNSRKEMELFWDHYHKALSEAELMTAVKSKAYVADESILAYWINGPSDIIYELNKKIIRLRRQVRTGEKFSKESGVDSIQDECLDIINYAAFLSAYLKTLEDRENNQHKD